jgi:adenylylsulfate kinase-like enzyme
VTAPYEVPERPDLHVQAAGEPPEEIVDRIIAHLAEIRLLEPEIS